MDWISDVLYWLEGDILSPGVWVSQLDGSDPVQIVGKHNMFKPTSIAIHPVAGSVPYDSEWVLNAAVFSTFKFISFSDHL